MYLMQYDPAYMKCDCHKGEVTRAAYNFHIRTKPNQKPVRSLLEDLIEIECNFSEAEAQQVQRWLKGLGYKSNSKKLFTRYESPTFSMVLNRKALNKPGISKIVCALRTDAQLKPQTFVFGEDCKLFVEGNQATWIFHGIESTKN